MDNAWHEPLALIEENGGFKVQGGKGFDVENVDELDENSYFGFLFYRQTQDAVKKTSCDIINEDVAPVIDSE